jgi:hypothetical protein
MMTEKKRDADQINAFPADIKLTEEQFATYLNILARRWAPQWKRNVLAPPSIEALSNATLDILTRNAYQQKFPNFDAFAAWLYRWTANMAKRAKRRSGEMLDIHELDATEPAPCPRPRCRGDQPFQLEEFKTRVCLACSVSHLVAEPAGAALVCSSLSCRHQYPRQPISTPFVARRSAPVIPWNNRYRGQLVEGIVEPTPEEAARRSWPYSEIHHVPYLKRWARDIRAESRRAMSRRHQTGEPGAVYSEWHWEHYWVLLAKPTALLPREPGEAWIYTGPFPTEAPNARDLIREWERHAYVGGVAAFKNYEGPIHWPRPDNGVSFEQSLTKRTDTRFVRLEKKEPRDRYTTSPEQNPHGSDRGWANRRAPISEAVTDQGAFEKLFPEAEAVVIAKRIAKIEKGIQAGRKEVERLKTQIADHQRAYRKARKREYAALRIHNQTGDGRELKTARAHFKLVTGRLNTLIARDNRIKGAMSGLARLIETLALPQSEE